MAQNVPLAHGDPAPEPFFDDVQEMLSGAAVNFEPVRLNSTTLRLPAGPDHEQVSLSIRGKYRYITAPIDRPHPPGAAGVYDLWATAAANDPVTHRPPGDNSAVALAITPTGVPPAGAALYRLMRRILWTGSAIARIDPLTPVPGVPPIGSQLPWSGLGDPADTDYLLADGRLVSAATYAGFLQVAGHVHNGGVDPGGGLVRLPDKRGRVAVGADNMGTATGAAGRLPNSLRARGQSGGAERHALAVAEMPSHTHDSLGGTLFIGMLNLFGGINNTNAALHSQGDGYRNASGALYGNTAATGGSAAHNNMPPYECDNWIVRVR